MLGIVSLNGGDAAILDAQLRVLRRQWPGAEITVHDRDPAAAGAYFPRLQFRPFLASAVSRPPGARRYRGDVRLRRGLACARASFAGLLPGGRWLRPAPLRRMDVAVYTGGTTLTENYSLRDKVFDLDLVRRAGVPYVFFPQSAGPFDQPENRRLLAPVLSGADLVLLRDERSLRHVGAAGALPEACRVVPDVVFALVRDDIASPPPRAPGPVRIAVSVREWRHYATRTAEDGRANCLAAFRALVTSLVRERGAEVTFISTCQGRPEYGFDDSVFAAEVVAGLVGDVAASVTVDGGLYDAEGLRDRLAGFDAMVSMRLHAAILAVCGGTPTLTVAYEYKSTEVWAQLGHPELSLDLESLDADELVARVGSLLDRRDEVAEDTAPVLAAWREEVMGLGPLVADVISASQAGRKRAGRVARRYASR